MSKNLKPIHKFNGGKGATLCHNCSVIITEGHTDHLYCGYCNHEEVEVYGAEEDTDKNLPELTIGDYIVGWISIIFWLVTIGAILYYIT